MKSNIKLITFVERTSFSTSTQINLNEIFLFKKIRIPKLNNISKDKILFPQKYNAYLKFIVYKQSFRN